MNRDEAHALVDALFANPVHAVAGGDPDDPFGRYPNGDVMAAPAYDGCRTLWEAGQRAGMFNIFAYAPGIEPGVIPGTHKGANPQIVEDAILTLARGPWGVSWLAVDANAVTLQGANGEHYQRLLNGYVVRAKSHNPDDGYVHVE